MTIIFPINELLFELFGLDDASDYELVIAKVREHYMQAGLTPDVRIANDHLEITLPEQELTGWQNAFDDAWKDCERGNFKAAKPKLLALVKQFPQHSTMQAVLGQVHFELEEYDEAMDHFIDALRWDPTNLRALIMMGNLWARVKGEPDTAITYYSEALRIRPEDHIAASNAAAILLDKGRALDAKKYLEKAIATDPKYPNSQFLMSRVSKELGEKNQAFDHAILAIGNASGPLLQGALELAMEIATELQKEQKGVLIVHELKKRLRQQSDKPIHLSQDNSIKTAAKLEVAENHGRDHHKVLFNQGYPATEHLQLHELYHLRYILEARAIGANMRFVTHPAHFRTFRRQHEGTVKKLVKAGVAEDSAERYLEALFHGFVLQIYNAPIDLFIEHDMYHEYPGIRPYQFLSLSRMLNDAIVACTDPKATSTAPAAVVSVSKVYNLMQALLLKELYGWDRMNELKATPKELQQAGVFYAEFKEYRKDREPAEEYEVVQNWGKDLLVDGFFLLEPETREKPAHDPLEQQLEGIEEDPIGDFEKDPEKVREMRDFQERQKEIGLNMAVVMFMVDAMRHFKSQSASDIRKAAFEIAMVGSQGIHPEKQGYKLASVPGKTFSGYHLLAYYYVSFKLVLPEMLADLQLPFDKEYDMAQQLIQTRQ